MFKLIRINKKIEVLLILLFLSFNIFTLSFLSDSYINIEDSDEVSENITYDYDVPHSSSTIEYTTITKQESPSYDFYVNMPSYRPDGDLYIAQIVMDEDRPFTSVPSGWTEIVNSIALKSGRDVRLATYWKIGNSEPTSYRWSCTTSYCLWIGAIYRISSFDSSDPIQASGIYSINYSSSINPTAPSVTTTIDDSLVLRMYGADNNSITSPYWPSGTTSLFQEECGYDSVRGGAAYHIQSSAGSTGSAQFTMGDADIWIAATIAIRPEQESTPPKYSDLVEIPGTLELGDTQTIRINVTDESGINQVLLEFGGSNHSMTYKSGDMWEYNSWIPNTLGIHAYTVWIDDFYGNTNSTSGSITVVDTTAPTYSDLLESADPLQLGQNETISIKVFDSPGSGVNKVTLEVDATTNYTMNNIGGNSWSTSNWRPTVQGTYNYKIYMQDLQGNWNITDTFNITVLPGTAPSIGNMTKIPDPLELGDYITINVDVKDGETFVDTVLIEFESVNYTMINTVGNEYEYNWTGGAVGVMIYKIYANDSSNDLNQLTGWFDIIDTTPPNYDNLTENSNSLELGEKLIVSIDAIDLSGINIVLIEFEGLNYTMAKSGNTYQRDQLESSTIGIHFYTIWIEDNNHNWNFTTDSIIVQDTTAPSFSNLTESSNPVELGENLVIEVIVNDIAGIKSVKIEFEGSNHSMVNLGGGLWQYEDWLPTSANNHSYTIYMEDNNNNWNVTSSSIDFQDNTIPAYSNLVENADPLELGNPVVITVEINDFAGINQSLIEFEGLNHTMSNIYGNVYQYSSWVPSNWITYQYTIHMEDNSGNKNVASGNITVQDTTPPSQPIFTNAPSGDVSGVLTFDWTDGSDPSGISYYILIIDNESNPDLTPGYVFMSNITNTGPESSYYELQESLPAGSYHYFLIQIDGVGRESSPTTGTFTMISIDDGNSEFMFFLIIGIIFASSIVTITAIVVVKRKLKNGNLPSRKKIPLKIVISHIENLVKSSQISEKPKKQKTKKSKEKVKATQQKDSINGEELTARINKIKSYGEKLFTEGAYLEAQKQFEFAEKILLKLGKNEEASIFSNLKIGIKELREERRKKLQLLEEEKLEGDSLKIFDLYYDLIELSEKLKDYGSVDMYLSELTHFYQTEQIKLRDLEYQRFKLYKQANSLIEEKDFEKAVEFYENCEKISQFLVQIGRENEKNNVKKFREKIEECLSKAAQK